VVEYRNGKKTKEIDNLDGISRSCKNPKIGNIFNSAKPDNVTDIVIVSMLGEVEDSDIDILSNRPATVGYSVS